MRLLTVVLALVVVGCAGRNAADANARGVECGRLGNEICAVREFAVAVELDGANPKYRRNLAIALARSGQFEQAAAELQMILRDDPDNIEARKSLAAVNESLRELQAVAVAEQLRRY